MILLNKSISGFNKICISIKYTFLLNPKLWQVSVIGNITQKKTL